MNYGHDMGRQSSGGRSYRDEQYEGRRETGRRDQDGPFYYDDEPRGRADESRGHGRGENDPRGTQRQERYETESYGSSERGRPYGSQQYGGQPYGSSYGAPQREERPLRYYDDEAGRVREYGNGERAFENSTDRSWPGEFRSGRKQSELARAEADREQGRSYTGESYGGSFAGPYARRSNGQGRMEDGEFRSGVGGGSYRGSSYGGGYGNSAYGGGSFGGVSEARGDERSSSSRSMGSNASRAERETHRGKGPKGYQRTDQRIQEELHEKLSDADDIDASEIECSVSEGEVTLTGTVTDRSMKRQAEDLAESISGVRHVQNNIRIQKESSKGDGDARKASSENRSNENRGNEQRANDNRSGSTLTPAQQQKDRNQSTDANKAKAH